MNYRLTRTTDANAEYQKFRIEFDDADATEAYLWLAANNPQFTSTITTPDGKRRVKISRWAEPWNGLQETLRTIRPEHCDRVTGQWIYVDGQWHPYEHGERLMSTYAAVVARLASAIPTPYHCAGHADGCQARVATRGALCATCQHDA